MTTTAGTESLSVDRLDPELYGQIIKPGDAEYDKARTVYAGGIDHRPAVIIRPADAVQVSRIVTLARKTGEELSIRSGGHSSVGHSISDGGICLDLAAMKGLDIDVEGRTAWVQTGMTTGEYVVAIGEHGLVTGFGDADTVGIGGIALGGGVGYLVRKHGLTVDDVLAAEIVTADGEILDVDEDNHPDLFWAIRGGGGNFGVVTRFKFRLHELESIYGGLLVLPATPEAIVAFVAASDAAPEELSTIANIMSAPPVPFLPEELHGTPVNFAMICYAGPTEAGEQALAPFRAITPLADMVETMPYSGMYPHEEEEHPVAASTNMFIDYVDLAVAENIVERLGSSTALMAATQLRVLGGAMARVPADATAFAHRKSRIMVNLAAVYEDPAEADHHAAWVADFAASLKQSDNGVYVNFLLNEGEERIRAAYPGGVYERLAKIKAKYDPANLFHLNQNIPPAADR
ncbi:FAD-binding oxidoreductase [Streptosporangium sp. NBC_01639]|uniref:FAD-binding oxidoreductase n=1 Tax=unclassified Streptosporangium TaxID=2632669 RepID=UPI002DD8C125|nr:FAD-binding oxidoreductase [Streptosporangium sp. NBC_01756]WSC85392.1 FAD-binding oxidoreductase [Streptosporangium sp. NBC_01756]WTD55972.1 FAD-binding oxidoreductase [Streptosporangium sp. NBC_01639]